MNKLEIGAIAKNKAGRDENALYIVIALDKDYAYVVDGSNRTLQKPKRKNPKHLQATGQKMQISIDLKSKDIDSENAKIRKELRRIEKTEVNNV